MFINDKKIRRGSQRLKEKKSSTVGTLDGFVLIKPSVDKKKLSEIYWLEQTSANLSAGNGVQSQKLGCSQTIELLSSSDEEMKHNERVKKAIKQKAHRSKFKSNELNGPKKRSVCSGKKKKRYKKRNNARDPDVIGRHKINGWYRKRAIRGSLRKKIKKRKYKSPVNSDSLIRAEKLMNSKKLAKKRRKCKVSKINRKMKKKISGTGESNSISPAIKLKRKIIARNRKKKKPRKVSIAESRTDSTEKHSKKKLKLKAKRKRKISETSSLVSSVQSWSLSSPKERCKKDADYYDNSVHKEALLWVEAQETIAASRNMSSEKDTFRTNPSKRKKKSGRKLTQAHLTTTKKSITTIKTTTHVDGVANHPAAQVKEKSKVIQHSACTSPILPLKHSTTNHKSKRLEHESRKKRKISHVLCSTVSPSLGPWYQALNSGQKIEFLQGVRLAKMKSEKRRQMKEQRLFNEGKVVHPWFAQSGAGYSTKNIFGTENYRQMWDGVGCPSFPEQFCSHIAARVHHSPQTHYKIPYVSKLVVVKNVNWPEELSKSLDDTPERKQPTLKVKPKAHQIFRNRTHFAQWLKTPKGTKFVKSTWLQFKGQNVQSELTFAYNRCIYPPKELLAIFQQDGSKRSSPNCYQEDIRNLTWPEKYRPLNTKELLESQPHTKDFKHWLEAWTSAVKKKSYISEKITKMAYSSEEEDLEVSKEKMMEACAILVGNHGSGKSALIYAAARDFGFKVLEIGPGSTRSGVALRKRVGEATLSKRLHGKKNTLILLDESDNVFEGHDQGYWKVVRELTQSSRRPIVMTCNSLIPDLLLLAPSCLVLEAAMPDRAKVELRVACIAMAEGVWVSVAHVKEIVEECGGDIRAALLKLQISSGPKPRCWKKNKQHQLEEVLSAGVGRLADSFVFTGGGHVMRPSLCPKWQNSISYDVKAFVTGILDKIAGEEESKSVRESDEELPLRRVSRSIRLQDFEEKFPQPLMEKFPTSSSQSSQSSLCEEVKVLEMLADLASIVGYSDIYNATTSSMHLLSGSSYWLHPHRLTEDYCELVDTVKECNEEHEIREVISIRSELSTVRSEMCFELMSLSLSQLGRSRHKKNNCFIPKPNRQLLQYLEDHLTGTVPGRHLLDCQEFLRTIMQVEDLKRKILRRERRSCFFSSTWLG